MGEWHKNLPHLPENARKWLADNAWWLVLVGVVFSVFAIFSLFSLLGWVSAVAGAYGVGPGANVMLSAFLGIAVLILVVILYALAISPLKAHLKRGWDLVFTASLISAAGRIISGIVGVDFGTILGSVIGLAISAYILFEVRDHFTPAGTPVTPTQ